MTVSGTGYRAAGQREDQERHDLGHGVDEDVADELAYVVIHTAAGLHGGGDGREVVIGQHHGGGLAGDVGAGTAHGDADVGAAQRGRVVDAISGHRDHVAEGPQRVRDAQLGLGRAAREDNLRPGTEHEVEIAFGHGVQFLAADDLHPAAPLPTPT
jgi:hypothetical protein